MRGENVWSLACWSLWSGALWLCIHEQGRMPGQRLADDRLRRWSAGLWIAASRAACAKHGVAPDLAAYQQGRSEGLQEYCQPTKGFALGSNGAAYAGVCPADLEADFLDAYNAGHHLRQLRASVASAAGQISYQKRALEQVKQDMVAREAALISDEATSEQRLVLLGQIKELSETRGQLQAEIEDLIVVRTQREGALYAYQAELKLE